jgi:7-cyano-7-deazaguanine synthase
LDRVAVLASGGLDSSVLLADLARDSVVHPLYVSKGLAWEEQERAALEAFLDALASPNIRPVTWLAAPARELYGDHWSLDGAGVPGLATPDSAVHLPGRNVLLIGLAAVWCSVHGVSRIAIGSLGGNPFADATSSFFKEFGRVLSQGLAHEITVAAPYRGSRKEDLIRRRHDLPLGLTLTCIAPEGAEHCGRCNKCGERQGAFAAAGVTDPTIYHANQA